MNVDGKMVKLVRCIDSALLANLRMGSGLGNFFHYRYRTAEKTREVLSLICKNQCDRVSGAIFEKTLVGYVTIVRPEDDSCWEKLNRLISEKYFDERKDVIFELGSIEVSTAWRARGIASGMLAFAFDDVELEENIVFTRELSWHWDLKSTGLTSYQYRTMLLRLFRRFGFKYYQTNDAEVCYSGESMFLARIGTKVLPEIAMEFYNLVCGSEIGGWGWG
jgi:acetoin utilization protein AcuA